MTSLQVTHNGPPAADEILNWRRMSADKELVSYETDLPDGCGKIRLEVEDANEHRKKVKQIEFSFNDPDNRKSIPSCLHPFLPKTILTGLSDDLGCEIASILLGEQKEGISAITGNTSGNKNTLSAMIGELWGLLTTFSGPGEFDINPSWLRIRLSTGERKAFLNYALENKPDEFCQHAPEAFESLPAVTAYETAFSAVQYLASGHADVDPGKFLQKSISAVMPGIQPHLFWGFANALAKELNFLPPNSDRLPESFCRALIEVTVSYLEGPLIYREEIKPAISRAFKFAHHLPRQMVPDLIVRTGKAAMPDSRAREQFILYLGDYVNGIYRDNPSLPSWVPPEADVTFKPVRITLPDEICNRMVTYTGDENHFTSLMRCVKVLPPVYQQRLADKIANAQGLRGLAMNLKFFSSLSARTGMELVNHGHILPVFESLNIFPFSISEQVNVVQGAMTSLSDEVLQKILDLPQPLQERLETHYSIASYKHDIGLASRKIYRQYRLEKLRGDPETLQSWVDEIKSLQRRLISSEPFSTDDAASPFYRELTNIVFPSHGAEVWGGAFGGVHGHMLPEQGNLNTREAPGRAAGDRSADLKKFVFAPKYTIDLSESVKMERTDGSLLDQQAFRKMIAPVEKALALLSREGQPVKPEKAILDFIASEKLDLPKEARSIEEKIYAAFTLAAALHKDGTPELERARVLAILYHFGSAVDLRGYLQGTRDQAEKSRNREYATLLSYHQFFSDTVADSLRRIEHKAMSEPVFARWFNGIALRVYSGSVQQKLTDLRNRLRADDLGVTPRLLSTLSKKIEAARRPNPDKTPAAARWQEAVARVITTAQERIREAMISTTGSAPSLDDIHLDDFSFASIEEVAKRSADATDDNTRAEAGLRRKASGLFSSQVSFLDSELGHYKPEVQTDRQIRKLEAFFTKNLPSSLARQVAGVCVSEDSQQWNLPNYFQLVFKDPELNRCEGLCLLHHYHTAQGKLLAVSFNPTSTFVLKVDEKELFKNIMNILADFAAKNGFDFIGSSTDPTIRTNRTGGLFEAALQRQIDKIGKQFSLPEDANFSFSPLYLQKKFDVLWVNDPERLTGLAKRLPPD